MANAKKNDPNVLRAQGAENERKDTREEISSKLLADSALQAAITLGKFANDATGTADLTRSMELAIARANRASGGDLAELEGMLANQATTLDVIFNSMARRSALNMGDYIGASETYMKLALRAQSQCRTTVAALAEIKNPNAVYISSQANITTGPQQVNNHAHGTETNITPNKLIEDHADASHQDTITKSIESRTNPTLEAMGAVNRPKVSTRKGQG